MPSALVTGDTNVWRAENDPSACLNSMPRPDCGFKPQDAGERGGTGFLFEEETAEAFCGAIQRGEDLFARPAEWKKLVRRGMGTDVSWDLPALRYEELYRAALSRRRREQ